MMTFFLGRMAIGERLKVYAKQRHRTQRVLAERIGVSESQFSDYVSGRVMPGMEVLERLAGLGLSIDWLLTGGGSMDAATTAPGVVADPRSPLPYGQVPQPIADEMQRAPVLTGNEALDSVARLRTISDLLAAEVERVAGMIGQGGAMRSGKG